ncbi:MAG: 16S rRNA (adenine(1518)-N(6)/adenine(1519)-N(6))-dimethyltransferase RsmA [Acidimicrobiales bacterium]
MPELNQSKRLTRPMVGDLIEQHGLNPSRALGQNFLCEPGMVDKIVRISGVRDGDNVIEIGPGLGSLTLGLADAGARVTAIEADRYLIPPLLDVLNTAGLSSHVTVMHADALELNWGELLADQSWKVVANLPYNVSTPLVLDLLRDQPSLTEWLVMVQQEAGERLAASSGTKTYGIPSVLLSYWARARVVDTVPSSVFLPRPRVSSALLKIERHEVLPIDASFERYATLVRAGFGKRRKMIRGSLSAHLTESQIESAGIAPTDRAENLTPEQWGILANL